MSRLIQESHKHLPERKYEVTREIKVEYFAGARFYRYELLMKFSGKTGPETKAVFLDLYDEGEDRLLISTLRGECAIVQKLCTKIYSELTEEMKTPEYVISDFPVFKLDESLYRVLGRWDAKLPNESTWRLCKTIIKGVYFLICGLGTMERRYSFAEGMSLKELPIRVREDILINFRGIDIDLPARLIDICSISRDRRGSNLPF